MLNQTQQDQIMEKLLHMPENSFCADCNSKTPCWASLDFGVFVCLNCSGAHRALGPTVTRVKSTKLDQWKTEWVDKMQLGNSHINLFWEFKLAASNAIKPNVSSSMDQIIKFVQDKYLRRKYVDPKQPLDPLAQAKLEVKTEKPPVRRPPVSEIPVPPKITTKPIIPNGRSISLLEDDPHQKATSPKVIKPQKDLFDFETADTHKGTTVIPNNAISMNQYASLPGSPSQSRVAPSASNMQAPLNMYPQLGQRPMGFPMQPMTTGIGMNIFYNPMQHATHLPPQHLHPMHMQMNMQSHQHGMYNNMNPMMQPQVAASHKMNNNSLKIDPSLLTLDVKEKPATVQGATSWTDDWK